jgi:hypothetical protein
MPIAASATEAQFSTVSMLGDIVSHLLITACYPPLRGVRRAVLEQGVKSRQIVRTQCELRNCLLFAQYVIAEMSVLDGLRRLRLVEVTETVAHYNKQDGGGRNSSSLAQRGGTLGHHRDAARQADNSKSGPARGVVGQEHPATVALLAGLTWASEEHTKLSEIV